MRTPAAETPLPAATSDPATADPATTNSANADPATTDSITPDARTPEPTGQRTGRAPVRARTWDEREPPGWAAIRAYLVDPIRAHSPLGRQAGVRRWRRSGVIWLVYLAYALTDVTHISLARGVLGVALLAAFCYLYIFPLPVAMFSGPRRARFLVLVGGPLITVVYLLFVGPGGLIFPTFLAVMFAMLLMPVISLPITVVMFAAVTWLPQYVPAWHLHGEQWSTAIPIGLVIFALHGMRAGARSQIELHQARQEIERLAQEQERLRISRDLHDLLGHALTTITVKAELASRLATRDPDRAAAEMAEVAALGREGLADVRATVAGYRNVSLVTELAAAREVLSAAGIQAELPAAVEEVPVDLRELFGWVLREAVTNVVRHSGATAVRVRITGRSIEVIDDGAGAPADEPAGTGETRRLGQARQRADGSSGGNGLVGLAERVAAAGGRLEAGPANSAAPPTGPDARSPDAGLLPVGDGFRLRAVVPA
jgi:two-component system, NarL family, sensor histidine kinase DesK